jgi:phosphoglycerate dehydrogenase-like enzyme
MSLPNNLIAIQPKSFAEYEEAVVIGGGVVSEINENVGALIWTDYSDPEGLSNLLLNNPQISWIQLPFAGVDAFKEILNAPLRFTSAKGSYKEPVAEHALALALALGRKIPVRVRATSWGKREAFSFYDSEVVIVGGGGIAEELVKLLRPFRANVKIVRNRPEVKLLGASETVGLDSLASVLPMADLVIIAAALTDETKGLFDLAMLSNMKKGSFLVNVARGPIVNTDDLLRALDQKLIAGAALDVTEPEPLPENHPAFGRQDLIITPHTADTKEMVIRLFSKRIIENVRAYQGKSPWVGEVDPKLGY